MALKLPNKDDNQNKKSPFGLKLPGERKERKERGSTSVPDRRKQIKDLQTTLRSENKLITPKTKSTTSSGKTFDFSVVPSNDLSQEFGSFVDRKTTTPATTKKSTLDNIGNLLDTTGELLGETMIAKRAERGVTEKTMDKLATEAFERVDDVSRRMANGEIKPENAGKIIDKTKELVDQTEVMLFEMDDQADCLRNPARVILHQGVLAPDAPPLIHAPQSRS